MLALIGRTFPASTIFPSFKHDCKGCLRSRNVTLQQSQLLNWTLFAALLVLPEESHGNLTGQLDLQPSTLFESDCRLGRLAGKFVTRGVIEL